MDLGLGNLIELKRQLLPSTILNQTTFDTQVEAIGKGVAAAMQRYCNRKFGRAEGDLAYFSADRDHYFLPRYPVEAITKVELSYEPGTWEEQTDAIANQELQSGWISFGGVLGDALTVVRVTYTGGYWYDTAETEDSVQPTGSVAVPDDLKLCWYMQSREVWNKADKLGTGIAQKPDQVTRLAELKWAPFVLVTLDQYRRFQIT